MQRFLSAVNGDDEEIAPRDEFDDRFCGVIAKGVASDDIFDFTRLLVTLALDDRAREENVFEIEDCEIVIGKFLCRVNRHGIVQGTN